MGVVQVAVHDEPDEIPRFVRELSEGSEEVSAGVEVLVLFGRERNVEAQDCGAG